MRARVTVTTDDGRAWSGDVFCLDGGEKSPSVILGLAKCRAFMGAWRPAEPPDQTVAQELESTAAPALSREHGGTGARVMRYDGQPAAVVTATGEQAVRLVAVLSQLIDAGVFSVDPRCRADWPGLEEEE